MSVHTDAKNGTRKSVLLKKKTPRVCFFGLTRRVKNYPTNEIGAFAHVSGAAEVTVKHNLGALKHKTVLPSTLPASASFPASFLIQQNNNFFIAGAAGAGASGV